MSVVLTLALFLVPVFLFLGIFSLVAKLGKIDIKHYWLGISATVIPWVFLLLLCIVVDEVFQKKFQNFLIPVFTFLLLGIPFISIIGAIVGLVFKNDGNKKFKIYLKISSIIALIGSVLVALFYLFFAE